MKSLLLKGTILPPLSYFGLILRSWLWPGNMKRNSNTWDLYNVHILSKDLKYLQSRLQIWEIMIQQKPESWTNAGQVAWGVNPLAKSMIKQGQSWLGRAGLNFSSQIYIINRQFYPFWNPTPTSRLLPRVKTRGSRLVLVTTHQDKKQEQGNTFISIWPRRQGLGGLIWEAIPSKNETKVSVH